LHSILFCILHSAFYSTFYSAFYLPNRYMLDFARWLREIGHATTMPSTYPALHTLESR